MKSKIIDGKALAGLVKKAIREQIPNMTGKNKRPPGLGVILVGDDPASKTYVGTKSKIALECGYLVKDIKLPSSASESQLVEAIEKLNNDPAIDGILLQLPLPKHLVATDFIKKISPSKDADGLHPFNQGLLLQGRATVFPCTPLGVTKLIDYHLFENKNQSDISFLKIPTQDLSGKTAIIIGRSILVGKPLSLMLLDRNATIITAHSKTKGLQELSRSADIVVACCGVAKLVKGSWIKDGGIVIDVGTTRGADGKLCGDVDFDEVTSIASAITPVPGGVGPMTVAMLMWNTLKLRELAGSNN